MVLICGLQALKLAAQAGSKIYANRQKAKMAMSEAQLLHAEKQARGEEAYQGKLLEARQSDWKDEFVLDYIVGADYSFGLGSRIGRSRSDGEGKIILRNVFSITILVYKPVDPCRCEYFGIKGTQIFSNGGKK